MLSETRTKVHLILNFLASNIFNHRVLSSLIISENCEDVLLEQHENDLLCFGASYPVSHPRMISRVLGVYSASNASKVCFGMEPEVQTIKETEDVDERKPATGVGKKHEKRKAENSEAAILNKGHKKKKKKTREK